MTYRYFTKSLCLLYSLFTDLLVSVALTYWLSIHCIIIISNLHPLHCWTYWTFTHCTSSILKPHSLNYRHIMPSYHVEVTITLAHFNNDIFYSMYHCCMNFFHEHIESSLAVHLWTLYFVSWFYWRTTVHLSKVLDLSSLHHCCIKLSYTLASASLS